jgi:hypothetical protein
MGFKPNPDFPETELEGSLRRAFVNHKADYVLMYRNSGQFLWDGVRLGVKNGWLEEKTVPIDDQETQVRYYLTATGKNHFGVKN